MRDRRVLLAVLAVLLATALAHAAPRAPELVVEAASYEFGTVDRGTIVEHAFRLRNQGTAMLRIEHVKSSCGCTVAVASGREMPPGGETEVTVRLDTARVTGRTKKTVTVYTNDPASPATGLTLTGQVATDLVVTPTPLYLGKIRRGEAVRRELRVAPGRPGASFAVTWVEHSNPIVRVTLTSLPGGAGQMIAVELDRDVPLGRFNDQLTLHTTSPRDPTLSVPVFGSVEGDVVVLPPQMTFGVTHAGAAPSRELYIRNRGPHPISVKNVVVPQDLVSYELDTVKAGLEYRLTLHLREGLPAGKVEGAVEIFTDHPEEGHVVVPLYAIVRAGAPRTGSRHDDS